MSEQIPVFVQYTRDLGPQLEKDKDEFRAANLFKDKAHKTCEMIIILFEKCNYNCVFCPQDHNSTVGMNREAIMDKAEKIVNYINSNTFASDFAIRVMGGELFTDDLIEAGFLDIYNEFMYYILSNAKLNNRPAKFYWISNFSFKKYREDIEVFITAQGEQGTFTVSYDPAGRFNPPELVIFKENVKLLSKHICNFNTTTTKQNIEAVLRGDEYFDYLCDNFGYSFDMYVKTIDSQDFSVPKESLVLEFYKRLADRYQNVEIIQPFLTPPETTGYNSTLCTRGNGYAINPAGENVSEGCLGTHYLGVQDHPILRSFNRKQDFLENIVTTFVDKYDCHSCEFYRRCPMVCFTSIKSGNMIDDMDKCINKLTFEYVDAKRKRQAK